MADLDAEIIEWVLLAKGDVLGHAFHGNQYTQFGSSTRLDNPHHQEAGSLYEPVETRFDKWGFKPRGVINGGGLDSASATTKNILDAAKKAQAYQALSYQDRRYAKPPTSPRYFVERAIEEREFATAKLRGLIKDVGSQNAAPYRAALRANTKYLDALRLAIPSMKVVNGRMVDTPSDYSQIAAKGVYNKADTTMAALPNNEQNGKMYWNVLTSPNQLSAYISQYTGQAAGNTAEHLDKLWGNPEWTEKGWGHAEWAARISDISRAITDFTAYAKKNPSETRLTSVDAANAKKLATLEGFGVKLKELAGAHSQHGGAMASHVSAFEGDEYESDAFYHSWGRRSKALTAETIDTLNKIATLLPKPPR